jgi:type VI secretion system protein VasJ
MVMNVAELGKKPIKPEAPAGADAKYEPEYEQVLAEVGKLASPSSSGGLNWTTVKENSVVIIGEKSKDLMIAAYLAAALLKLEKIDGFTAGVNLMKDVAETFWNDLFPPVKRMRARKNAVEWLFTQSIDIVAGLKLEPQPEEKMAALFAAVKGLMDVLNKNMEDPPLSREFEDALRQIPVKPKAAPPPPPAAAPPAGQPAAPRPAAAPAPAAAMPAVEAAGEMGSAQDAMKVVAASLKNMKQAANFIFETDPSNFAPYQVNRLFAWMTLTALPVNENKITKVPPPPEQVRGILQNLESGGDAMALLKAAEPKVPQFLFWLDLSRLVHDALDRLGPQFGKAKDAVDRETLAFVKRLKGIETFAFSDETPFADPATRQWLNDLAAAGGGGGTAASGGGGDPEAARVNEGLEEAKKLAKEKGLAEGVEVLTQGLLSGSGRARLLTRIAMVKLLVSGKKEKTALPHVRKIMEDVDKFGLEQWDPNLALEGLKAVLSAVRGQKDEPSVKLTIEIMSRISALNPGEALRLE